LLTSDDVHFARIQPVLRAFATAAAGADKATPLLELRVMQPPNQPTAPGPINRARVGGTTVSGKLDPKLIQSTVRANFGQLRQCYDAGLKKDRALRGRISIRFVIARDGSVPSAQVAETELPEFVSQCVLAAFRGIAFPKPEGGIVTAVYPIRFEPE
jgi:hypothetical protein